MNQTEHRLEETIESFYNKEVLFKLYESYLFDWIADGYIGNDLTLFQVSSISEKSDKSLFCKLMYQFYSDEQVFNKIFKQFDLKLQELFFEIAWKEKFLIEKNKVGDFFTGDAYDRKLKDKYSFFKVVKDNKKNIFLVLDYEISRKIRFYMKKPKDYFLIDVKKPEALLKNENSQRFLSKMHLYLDFYKQDGMKISNNGKILKKTKITMQQHCKISEYYVSTEQNLSYLKTETIALFFHLLKDNYKKEKYFNYKNIKEIINDLFNAKNIKSDNFEYSSLFLNHLKGVKNIWKNKEETKRMFQSIVDILKEIQPNQIISVDNILNSLLFKDKFIGLISKEDLKDYVYISEINSERKKITTKDEYIEYITKPFVKSFLFLIATLGIFEIFYDFPNDDPSNNARLGYTNKYSGIKYIKLTDLGSYIFDKTDTFDFECDIKDTEIILDEDDLLITLKGHSPTKTMFLKKIGKMILQDKYKITLKSFLKEVWNIDDFNNNITEFEKITIDKKLPDIWTTFIEELKNKSNDIIKKEDYCLFKIADNSELISIIATDNRFKDLVLQVQNYHILVKQENIKKLLTLLKELGFFINND